MFIRDSAQNEKEKKAEYFLIKKTVKREALKAEKQKELHQTAVASMAK